MTLKFRMKTTIELHDLVHYFRLESPTSRVNGKSLTARPPLTLRGEEVWKVKIIVLYAYIYNNLIDTRVKVFCIFTDTVDRLFLIICIVVVNYPNSLAYFVMNSKQLCCCHLAVSWYLSSSFIFKTSISKLGLEEAQILFIAAREGLVCLTRVFWNRPGWV